METGMLHTHVLTAVLYMVLLLFTIILMALRKPDLMEKWRGKLKILHIVLGTIFLLTGLFLVWRAPNPLADYMLVKYVLVILAVPAGIIGSRRNSPVLSILAFVILIYVAGVSRTDSLMLQSKKSQLASTQQKSKGQDPAMRGFEIYDVYCTACHGPRGTLEFQGARNLQESTMTEEQVRQLLKNGKGVMPAFDDLDAEDMELIFAYLKSLRTDQN